MDELDNLLRALGIHDDFDLIGHSWGGKKKKFTKSPILAIS